MGMNKLEQEILSPVYVNLSTRLNVSQTLWIYLTYPSVTQPIEGAWKGEAKPGGRLGDLSVYAKQANHSDLFWREKLRF